MTKLGDFVAKRRAELGMTQEQLAQAAGLSDAAVGKIERGETRRPNNVEALARALDTSPPRLRTLVAEDNGGPVYAGRGKWRMTALPEVEFGPAIVSPTIPLLGSAYGGKNESDLNINDETKRVKTPPCLENVEDAYAVHVRGESMIPRYYPGEMLYVHPTKSLVRDAFCVVQIKVPGADTPSEAYVKQYVGTDYPEWDEEYAKTRVVFRQLNPEKIVDWAIDEIYAIHPIVGTQS